MSTNSSEQILAGLLNQGQAILAEQEQAVKVTEARVKGGRNVIQEMEQVQAEIEQAAQDRDERRRASRVRVLETTLEELKKDAAQEEQDLAKAVFGLNALIESMGAEYSNLGKLSSQEEGLVEAAREALREAEADLKKAGQKWLFKKSAQEEAQAAIKVAKSNIETAQQEAKSLARRRLLKADMEQALQEFQLRVENTITIMEARREKIVEQLQIVGNRKQVAFRIKEEAARALEKLDKELNEKEADLQREEEVLQILVNGTSEHSEQDSKVSNLRAEVEELRGQRNTAFTLYQSKENFAAQLEVHQQTQQKLRDNLMMWITALRSDTEERVITFKSRLEAQKALADQDVASELDKLGAAVDQKNLDFMAAASASTDRLRMKKLEEHPDRLKDVAATRAAQVEATAQIRDREAKLIEEFKQKYGIDPTASSFFHYQSGDGATTEGGQL
jgi:hypothetical protein